MEKDFIIKNLKKDRFAPFNVTDEELISFALDESSLVSDETTINGKSARDLVILFYDKRDKFRQNTRLGHIIVKENNLSKDDLIKALAYHEENEVPLGEAFVRLNICTEDQIQKALQTQSQMRNFIR